VREIIEKGDERGEFVADVDGFVYWWPDGSPRGRLSSRHLRRIADELDRRNEKSQKNIDDYFSTDDVPRKFEDDFLDKVKPPDREVATLLEDNFWELL
jgi:hypothetical protein